MIPDTYQQVFELLRERTKTGEVRWKATPDSDTFAVYLKEFSVMIGLYNRQGYNEPSEDYVRFEILNSDGEEIDSFEVGEHANRPEAFDAALELHASARRKAMRIDDAISEMLKELKGEGPVGEETKPESKSEGFSSDPFEEDDDLPF